MLVKIKCLKCQCENVVNGQKAIDKFLSLHKQTCKIDNMTGRDTKLSDVQEVIPQVTHKEYYK